MTILLECIFHTIEVNRIGINSETHELIFELNGHTSQDVKIEFEFVTGNII